jgi:Mu transposase-like protein
VRRTLTVRADVDQVRIFDGAEMIASHRRSYDRDAQIEDPHHLQALAPGPLPGWRGRK